MQGISDREYALVRYANVLAELLEPACTLAATPLDVAAWQTDERQARAAAERARYRRVELGWRWGPAWSTAWFRLRGRASEAQRALLGAASADGQVGEQDGPYLAVRFSSGTEATVWDGDTPVRGFDANRDLLRLDAAAAGHRVELLVEAACNQPLGVSTFWWDGPEVQARWREATPGRLEAAELVVRHAGLEAAVADYRFVVETVRALDAPGGPGPADGSAGPAPADPRALELLRLLRRVTDDLERLRPTDPAALVAILAPLAAAYDDDPARPAVSLCHAVGHAHLDTAWLWPLAETRRKAQRSWSNTLELLDRDPAFRFVATQPQQYVWLQEDAPALFARVHAAVERGAWEPGGATWIEPDCWAPSAEALARQLVLGQAWNRATFGAGSEPAYLFLPDTFGFPACLPQLMRAAGLDTFVTNKLAWSERSAFPHATFLWRGLDGAAVVAHQTPGGDYNATLSPAELARGERRLVERDGGPIGPERAFVDRWLQPFGHGDGGGGPTGGMLERADRADRSPGLPRLVRSTLGAFCDGLHEDLVAAARDGRHAPVWDGELYIENHRGTLTSQAWLKAANARVERDLVRVEELLATRLLLTGTDRPEPKLRRRLDAAWKQLLLHQFHDILPGSSIQVVFDEAREAFRSLEREVAALARAVAGATTKDPRRPLPRLTAEPLPEPAHAVDALGLVELDVEAEDGVATLRSDHLVVEVHATGTVYLRRRRLVDDDAPLGPLGTGDADDDGDFDARHELWLYGDRPRQWDAWNVDFDHLESGAPVRGRGKAAPKAVTRDGTRTAVEVPLRAGSSALTLRVALRPGSAVAEVEVVGRWREDRRLLRARVATRVRAQRWTTGTQLGYLERPTHANDVLDEARFEVPGQRWMDVAMPGLGVAVVDDHQLGRSCGVGPAAGSRELGDSETGPGPDRRAPAERPAAAAAPLFARADAHATLGLTLLRAPSFPDPTSDRERHALRYGLLLHDGDWRAARVPDVAAAFADRPHADDGVHLPDELAADLSRGPFDLAVEPPGAVEVLAVKPAEAGGGLVVRLAERHGGSATAHLTWARPVTGVRDVDLRERELDEARAAWSARRPGAPTPFDAPGPLAHDGAATRLELAPFELRTLRVDLPG